MRFLLAALLAWFGTAWAQSDTPAGLWTTFSDATGKPEGLVRIEERDGEFRGFVVKVFNTETPHPLCERCDGPLKDKPVVGMTILRGLRRDGGGFAGGTILDPDEGRTYPCTATLLEGGRKLAVHGYVGVPVFGRTQVWRRTE
jgi:uncharacterized protein (DUF2147 family)